MEAGLPSPLAVVGLGYVGLPLACAFARIMTTIGFDVDALRVRELREGYDRHGEVDPEGLRAESLHLTCDPTELSKASFIIVAVPTPVDRFKHPDLSYLVAASRLVGGALKLAGATGGKAAPIVVYEGTVFPGCTEEVCLPILAEESGLKAGRDFKVGYSPERMSPGEPAHTVDKVVKVIAAQDAQTAEVMERLYGRIVKAGVHRALDIRTAEAAKLVENVQRDVNIALMNEFALLFHRLGLETKEVLKTSRTKWNFLPFEPGLVGGQCIPVNPHYLLHKAEEVGFAAELTGSARRINDGMSSFVAGETVRLLAQAGKVVRDAKILVLGAAFKENVSDVRGSRVTDLVAALKSFAVEPFAYDPLVGPEALRRLGLRPVPDPFQKPGLSSGAYDAVILAVPHRAFRELPAQRYVDLLRTEDGTGVLVDIRGILAPFAPVENILYWTL